MQRVPDPYRALGVLRGATDAQIKAAHRRLAKRFHPDAATGDTDRFLAIQEAYLLLSDPLRRKEWDQANGAGPIRAGDPGRARARGGRPAGARPTTGERAAPRTGGGPGAGAGAPGPGPAPGAGRPGGAWEEGAAGGRPGDRRSAGSQGSGPGGPAWGATDRDPAAHTSTWSAAGVPWWEDFSPRDRGAASAGAGSGRRGGGTRPAGSPPPGGKGSGTPRGGPMGTTGGATGTGARDRTAGPARGTTGGTPTGGYRPGGRSPEEMDVYARSSGAAWSMAARRYFRKGEADLPKGGAWTYRGTQVVTGAEARKVAEEAAARTRAAESVLRPRDPGSAPAAGGRTAFAHDPAPPAPPAPSGPPRSAAAHGPRPASPGSQRSTSAAAAPRSALPATDRPSLLRRMRRALGLG